MLTLTMMMMMTMMKMMTMILRMMMPMMMLMMMILNPEVLFLYLGALEVAALILKCFEALKLLIF